MPKGYFADLGVKAALWKIQAQSPFCRMMHRGDDGEVDTNRQTKPEWVPSEAGVAWAIYERAVLDAYGFTSPPTAGRGKEGKEMQEARQVAKTGCIALQGGRSLDLLGGLGIDKEWAQDVLQDVVGRFNRMVADGWSPHG